jgi:hypothetical protein
LLLDPDYIILDTSGADTISSGTVLVGDNPNGTGTLDLNVNSAFANLAVSTIILQAAVDITTRWWHIVEPEPDHRGKFRRSDQRPTDTGSRAQHHLSI